MKCLTIFLASTFLFVLSNQTIAQGSFKKVKFLPGYTLATEQGSLTGKEYMDYKLEVAPGQTLTVTLTSRSPATSFNIHPPQSPDTAMYIGAVSGNKFRRKLDERGEYTIRVMQNPAAAKRNERVAYTLNMEVSGGIAANDTLVKGTPYHATGQVQAALGNNPLGTTNAAFGVTRLGLNEADIHLTLTKGKKRQIRYSHDRFVCIAPSGCKVTAERQGVDSWHVVINGNEHYLIPDSLISGGG